jgi:hypothetical protein
MKIEGMGAPQQPDPKGKKNRNIDRADKAKDALKQSADSIELKKEARETGKAAAYKPDVARTEQPTTTDSGKNLAELQRKSSDGYYDSREVREQTSDKLLASNDLKDVVNDYHLSEATKEIMAQIPEVRHDRIADVNQKIAAGYYDNPANFGDFADKIISYFGIR